VHDSNPVAIEGGRQGGEAARRRDTNNREEGKGQDKRARHCCRVTRYLHMGFCGTSKIGTVLPRFENY